MNLRQLEIFIAVAETGSFTRGAELTLLTQSTVSQHIAALEDEIGLRLLDRNGRGAELTVGGELFLQQAHKVLAEVRALRQAMNRFCGLEEAILRIGAGTAPATYLIPRLLPSLHREHPGLSLDVVSRNSRAVLDDLLANEVELAVVGNRFDLPGCDFVPLLDDPLILVVGQGHRWFGLPRLALGEVGSESLILREEGSGSGRALLDHWQKLCGTAAEPHIAARLGSTAAVKEAVLAGFASFLPRCSVARELADGTLWQIEVAGLEISRSFWLVTRSGRALSPAAQTFIPLLKDYCSSF